MKKEKEFVEDIPLKERVDLEELLELEEEKFKESLVVESEEL